MTTRNGRMLQNRIAQIFLRPKRLAAIEACLIGLVSGLAARALGESVSWLGAGDSTPPA